MNLLYFKLNSGEEIIAPATKVDIGWHVVNPAILIGMPEHKIALATWLPYTTIQDGGLIPSSAIMLTLNVAEDMAEYYTKWINPNAEDIIKVGADGNVLPK